MKRQRLSDPRSRPRTNSRGYLMLDLIIVMMITTVVLSTTSVWLYKTIRYTAEVSQRDAHARTISRISRQLRSDARAADSITVESNLLTIKTGSTSVEYKIDVNSIHRTRTGGDKVHNDDFEFVDNANLVWSEESEAIALEIRRDFSHLSASKSVKPARLDVRIAIRAPTEASEASK